MCITLCIAIEEGVGVWYTLALPKLEILIPCRSRAPGDDNVIPGRKGARYRISTKNDSFTAWQYWEADSKSRTWETNVWMPRRTFLATTRRQLQQSWILAIACLLLIWVLPFNLFSKLSASVNFTTHKCSSSVRSIFSASASTVQFSSPLVSPQPQFGSQFGTTLPQLTPPRSHPQFASLFTSSQSTPHATTSGLPMALPIRQKTNTTSLSSSEISKQGLVTTEVFFNQYRNLKGDLELECFQ